MLFKEKRKEPWCELRRYWEAGNHSVGSSARTITQDSLLALRQRRDEPRRRTLELVLAGATGLCVHRQNYKIAISQWNLEKVWKAKVPLCGCLWKQVRETVLAFPTFLLPGKSHCCLQVVLDKGRIPHVPIPLTVLVRQKGHQEKWGYCSSTTNLLSILLLSILLLFYIYLFSVYVCMYTCMWKSENTKSVCLLPSCSVWGSNLGWTVRLGNKLIICYLALLWPPFWPWSACWLQPAMPASQRAPIFPPNFLSLAQGRLRENLNALSSLNTQCVKSNVLSALWVVFWVCVNEYMY